MSRRNPFHFAAALMLAALPAFAQTPSPLDPARFAFPGARSEPGSAASASLGLADRWLGDQPFDNPASRPARGIAVSPVLLRLSRQDLRSDNRNYSEESAFLDLAGGLVTVPFRSMALFVYAHQPVLRHESNGYNRGNGIAGGPPAVIRTEAESRAARIGIGGSWGSDALRVGLAGEWTSRNDRYNYTELSGTPDPGSHTLDFKGHAVGAQAGVRVERGSERPGGLVVGAALRVEAALDVSGQSLDDVTSGSSVTPASASRAGGWEGGLSTRVVVTPTFCALASLGGRGARSWEGFGVGTGWGFEWRVGGVFHDPETPWTARFGVGQEQETGTPEPRAGVLGVGIGWLLDSTTLDFALLHRTLQRGGQPNSFDDRALATVTVAF